MTNLDIWIYSTRINTLQTAIFAKCGRCGYLPTLLNQKVAIVGYDHMGGYSGEDESRGTVVVVLIMSS